MCAVCEILYEVDAVSYVYPLIFIVCTSVPRPQRGTDMCTGSCAAHVSGVPCDCAVHIACTVHHRLVIVLLCRYSVVGELIVSKYIAELINN